MKIQKICSALIGSFLLIAGGASVPAFAEEEAATAFYHSDVVMTLSDEPDQDGIRMNDDGTASYYCNGVKQTGIFSVTPDYVVADINGDGAANAQDATMILSITAREATGDGTASDLIVAESGYIKTNYQAIQICDANHDGVIDAADATLVLIYAAQSGAGAVSKPLGYAVFCADEEGVLQKGWIKDGSDVYFGSDKYLLSTGWNTIDGKRFLFTEDCTMVKNELHDLNGKVYYLDSDGTCLSNTWLEIGGSMHYFGETGEMLTGMQKINGALYAFDDEGNCLSGWFEKKDARYYANSGGLLATGLQTIEEKHYYFDENGVLLTGWIKMDNATRYADADGVLVTGDQEIDGVQYHFNEDGTLTINGWTTVDGKKRYALNDGTYLTGLQTIGDQMYAFDGEGNLLTGWILSGGSYHYALENGTICKGLYKFNEKYVYFDDIDGSMVKGWKTIGGAQYYFDENGIMVTGDQIIDGQKYTFDAEGKLSNHVYKVCLDAGHYTGQNRSPVNPAYYEADFTWNFQFYLADSLRAHGIEVIMTRTNKDVDMELEARGRYSAGCDLFLSIHSNAAGNSANCNTAADGPMACTHVDGSTNYIGQLLADTVARVMETNNPGTVWARPYPNKEYQDYYAVLRGAKQVGTPGVLLEHSYHTNYRATVWLMDNSNLQRMADAEAQTIANYFGLS